jgi:hypothetical protein
VVVESCDRTQIITNHSFEMPCFTNHPKLELAGWLV